MTTNLNESEHPLVTPTFVGTDDEKMSVLQYWSNLIGLVRSMNAVVITHENKLAILIQIQKEIDLISAEVNNITAKLSTDQDGAPELTQDVTKQDQTVDLTIPESVQEIDCFTGRPISKFNPTVISKAEQMQRLAGNYYSSKAKKK